MDEDASLEGRLGRNGSFSVMEKGEICWLVSSMNSILMASLLAERTEAVQDRWIPGSID